MGRHKATTMPYFKHDTDMSADELLEALEARHKLIGYAIYIKLLERIYAVMGDYRLKDPATLASFAKKTGLDEAEILAIVQDAVLFGLFDRLPWEQDGTLTSRRIREQIALMEETRALSREGKKRAADAEKDGPEGFYSDRKTPKENPQGKSTRKKDKENQHETPKEDDIPAGKSIRNTDKESGQGKGTYILEEEEEERGRREGEEEESGEKSKRLSRDSWPDQAWPPARPDVDKLRGFLKAGFEAKNLNTEGVPFFPNQGKEQKALSTLVTLIRGKWPGFEEEAAGRLMERFYSRTQGSDRFFQGKPFLPSFLAAGGVFPQIAADVDKDMIPTETSTEFKELNYDHA